MNGDLDPRTIVHEGFGWSITDAPGWHAARESVREAAVAGQGRRTDRAYRRGLRGRWQR